MPDPCEMHENGCQSSRDTPALYDQILHSDQFTFFVGEQRKPLVVHSAALALQSKALNRMINGPMSEAKTRSAILDDVSEEDFIRLCQFAYTGDYTTPLPMIEEPTSAMASQEPAAIDSAAAPPLPPSEPDAEPTLEPPVTEGPMPDEIPPVEADWGFRTVGKKKRSRKIRFRQSFEQKSLSSIPPRRIIFDSYEPTANDDSSENFATVFLAHARIYVVADKYGIESLRSLVLQKLHSTLVRFTLYEARIKDVAELIKYIYSNDNTPDYDNRVDDLRLLVSEYSVCEIDTLGRSTDFIALMEEGGSFIRDWWKLMREHII